jgi:hypothetical protein
MVIGVGGDWLVDVLVKVPNGGVFTALYTLASQLAADLRVAIDWQQGMRRLVTNRSFNQPHFLHQIGQAVLFPAQQQQVQVECAVEVLRCFISSDLRRGGFFSGWLRAEDGRGMAPGGEVVTWQRVAKPEEYMAEVQQMVSSEDVLVRITEGVLLWFASYLYNSGFYKKPNSRVVPFSLHAFVVQRMHVLDSREHQALLKSEEEQQEQAGHAAGRDYLEQQVRSREQPLRNFMPGVASPGQYYWKAAAGFHWRLHPQDQIEALAGYAVAYYEAWAPGVILRYQQARELEWHEQQQRLRWQHREQQEQEGRGGDVQQEQQQQQVQQQEVVGGEPSQPQQQKRRRVFGQYPAWRMSPVPAAPAAQTGAVAAVSSIVAAASAPIAAAAAGSSSAEPSAGSSASAAGAMPAAAPGPSSSSLEMWARQVRPGLKLKQICDRAMPKPGRHDDLREGYIMPHSQVVVQLQTALVQGGLLHVGQEQERILDPVQSFLMAAKVHVCRILYREEGGKVLISMIVRPRKDTKEPQGWRQYNMEDAELSAPLDLMAAKDPRVLPALKQCNPSRLTSAGINVEVSSPANHRNMCFAVAVGIAVHLVWRQGVNVAALPLEVAEVLARCPPSWPPAAPAPSTTGGKVAALAGRLYLD